tara:strand:- start:44 stop:745 length:702 start_codon:yes stop_codon:yes gene_type:complete
MSLVTNITDLTTRIATETKSIRTLLNGNAADLTSLTTTAKTNLVAALNEVKGLVDTLDSEVTTLSGDLTTLDGTVTALDGDITTLEGSVGTLASLTTIDKTSLVSALNEVVTSLSSIDVTAQIESYIDDGATAIDSLWSSSKVDSEIANAVSGLVDGAPGLLDTLNELAAALGDDANFASTISAQIAGKADSVHTHTIANVTGLQTALDGKALASDVGDTTTNFVTGFEAGLV